MGIEAIYSYQDTANEIRERTGFNVGNSSGRCDSCNDPGAVEVLELGSQLFCPSCAEDAWGEYQEWLDPASHG